MRQLNTDDFSVGMLIVGMGRPPREVPVYGGMFDMTVVGTITREDNSHRGDVYRVECVDLPFIVLRKVVTRSGTVVAETSFDGKPFAHDTREGFRWAIASDEFVSALRGGAA